MFQDRLELVPIEEKILVRVRLESVLRAQDTAAVVPLFLSIGVVLLALNAFFVLAEFAMVKMRPSRVEELVGQGNRRAKTVQHIHDRLDDYLSVCQVGITFASIGLGFVGEPAIARLVEPFLGWLGAYSELGAHTVAVSLAYLIVSFLHILMGELVPKSIAIRSTEKAALMTAIPLRFFHAVFYLPLAILNSSANLVVGLMGFPRDRPDETHSEEELKILLEKSQTTGMMSFRRLLLFENVFDLGETRVKDAMRARDQVKILIAGAPWEENLKTMEASRLTRFPLVKPDSQHPIGVVHVKDMIYAGIKKLEGVDLEALARKCIVVPEEAPLESLLAEFQRKRGHLAIVLDKQDRWTGIITLEDIIEEIVGTVEDEFEVEPPLFLADAITLGRVVLGVNASSIDDALKLALARIPKGELPIPPEETYRLVRQRATLVGTYLWRGLCVPHARVPSISKPLLVFIRSDQGIPIRGREERIHLIFCLLTPSNMMHAQSRLLARVGGLLDSEFVEERLRDATTAQEVVEAIRAGEAAALG